MIAERVLKEVNERLRFLLDVGLDYLSLNRSAGTLAGGEAQRIRLASQIGSGLTGVLYVLDEPSIGLHQRDNQRLIDTMLRLRDLGNTVIVVEHDEETIRVADHVVDIGPGAGEHGGEIVVAGTLKDLLKKKDSITGQYLTGKRTHPDPGDAPSAGRGLDHGAGRARAQPQGHRRRVPARVPRRGHRGERERQEHARQRHPVPRADAADLPVAHASRVGTRRSTAPRRSTRSSTSISRRSGARPGRTRPRTPGVFDKVRTLFAKTPEAKVAGYQPGRFSFNVKGGRCEACSGDGTIKIEMHFLPDVYVPCEVCKGARYNRDTLDVTFKGKNIAEVLDLSIEEAVEFFVNQPTIARTLQTLFDVGLGYVRLGQPAPTLSGGEAQRVKLASELGKRSTGQHDLHPRRAHHRAPLRRRAPAPRRARPSRRRGQHGARDRAQPRRDQVGRLDRRPRARGRRRRRRGRRRGHARTGREERRQPHRSVPRADPRYRLARTRVAVVGELIQLPAPTVDPSHVLRTPAGWERKPTRRRAGSPAQRVRAPRGARR